MEKKRKIEIVGKKISLSQSEEEDIFYWADKTWQERIIEAERLRRLIWTHRLGKFPTSFQKIGAKVSKNQLAENDF